MSAFVPCRILLVLAFFAIVGTLHAQDIDTMKTWSVEEFAQKLTDQMTPRVPLAPDQIDMVYKINLKFAGQAMPVLKGPDDQNKKIAQVKAFDTTRAQELEVFLNTEQMRQVRQIQGENRRKMKQHYYEKHL